MLIVEFVLHLLPHTIRESISDVLLRTEKMLNKEIRV